MPGPDREVLGDEGPRARRSGIVVGDRVALVGDVSGQPDALARIVRVEPRTSVLRRSADDTDPIERVLVANADQLGIVTALADPEPRTGLIDRCLVAAFDAGMTPLLILTKSDLEGPEELLATYASLDMPYVVTDQRRRPRRAARSARRADDRARRPQRRRQVDARQRPRARSHCARSGASTRSPAGAGTRRPRPIDPADPDTARTSPRRGSSTHPGSGRSGSPTSTRRGSSRPSPTSRREPANAHAGAPTTSPSAGSMPGSPTGTPPRSGWTRCGDCCVPAPTTSVASSPATRTRPATTPIPTDPGYLWLVAFTIGAQWDREPASPVQTM